MDEAVRVMKFSGVKHAELYFSEKNEDHALSGLMNFTKKEMDAVHIGYS